MSGHIELDRAGLSFVREQEHPIYYEEIEVGTRRADFVVENQVVVELKALVALQDVHLAQWKKYVVAYDFPKGLLINFGGKSLEYKLLFNLKYNEWVGWRNFQDCSRCNGLHSEILKSLESYPW